jgi:hypothetical protein
MKYIHHSKVDATKTVALCQESGEVSDGYLVTKENGEQEWMPTDEFEAEYTPAETHRQRLNIEYNEVSERLESITNFITSEAFKSLPETEQILLRTQCDAILSYSLLLMNRLESSHAKVDYKHGIGVAMAYIKAGGIARRAHWSAYKYISMQVPNNIDNTIVPKMSSLSSQAKKFVLNTAGCIKYHSQCLLHDVATGGATSWTPTIEDLLADDWELIAL